jgi:tetratricopeptide (TPR) repeat protein
VEELLAVAGDEGELPGSLEAVVLLQLDQLPPDERRLVQVASVLGSSFDPALLDAVAVAEGLSIAPGSVDEHLVVEADGRRRFRHRLLRDVAYDGLAYGRRRSLHGAVADAIDAATDDPMGRAEVRSLHCLHAGRYAEALRFGRHAADRARRGGRAVEARALYLRCLDAARHLPRLPARRRASLWVRFGEMCQRMGRFDEANEAYCMVRRLRPEDPVVQAQMAYRHAELAERQGRPRAEAAWIARGLRALGSALPGVDVERERAHLLILRASMHYRRGQLLEAKQWATAAIETAHGAAAAEPRAQALELLDVIHAGLGRLDLATNGEEAVAIYRRLRNWDSVGRLSNTLGAFAYYRGEWAEAVRLYDEARRQFEKIGNLVDATLGSSNIAEIFADQGRLDEAEAVLVEAIDAWRSMAFPLGLARATRYLGRVKLRRGEPVHALELFDVARPTFVEYGLVGNVHEVDVWRAECLMRMGDLGGSTALLDEALAFERSTGGTDLGPMVHRLRGAVAAAEGRVADAWAEVDESLHLARARGAAFDVALALEALSLLAELGGPMLEPTAQEERAQLLTALSIVRVPTVLLP